MFALHACSPVPQVKSSSISPLTRRRYISSFLTLHQPAKKRHVFESAWTPSSRFSFHHSAARAQS
jgi:hypothetical protein